MSKKAEAKNSKPEKAKRPSRIPMSVGTKLQYHGDLDPEFYHRWMQDRDGRLDQAKAAGYEFVTENGNRVSRRSGAYTLFLMRLPEKYRIEDEKLKLEQTKSKLKAENELKEGEYVPNGKSHALEADEYDPLG